MKPSTRSFEARLLDAVEVLHAHSHGAFHERLFEASHLLFKDSCHSFEMYDQTDQSQQVIAFTDVPFPEAKQQEILQRIGELVPMENPILPVLLGGEKHPVRMTDLITMRQFRRTALYDEIFKPVSLRYQMVIPVHTTTHAGGLPINRGTKDFTDSEVQAAIRFARHLILAYDTDLLLQKCVPAKKAQEGTDYLQLRRLGLTRRECEVLWWVAQGKRDQEIAVILGIAYRTVNHHVQHILSKMNVETRTAAAALALTLLQE